MRCRADDSMILLTLLPRFLLSCLSICSNEYISFDFWYQFDEYLLECLNMRSHIHWPVLVSPFEIRIYCLLLLIFPSNSYVWWSPCSNANSLSKFTYVLFFYWSSLSSWYSELIFLCIHIYNILVLILFEFTYIMMVLVLFGFMTFRYWSSLNFHL